MASKDHGLLTPKVVASEKPPLIPRALRRHEITYNLPHAEAVAKYGRWSMKMLKENFVAGVFVKAGETFQIPGNDAVLLAMHGNAEFIDNSIAEEEAALATLKKLDRPIDRRQLAEFK